MDKVWWIVVLSVVLLGGLVLWISPAGDMVGSFAQDTLGFSTMSLSQVNLQSNFAPLSGQAWLMTFRLGGLSQSANFVTDTVSPDDVKAFSSGAFPKDSFKLDVKLDSQTCNYDIVPDTTLTPVYRLSFVKWGRILSTCTVADAVSKCGSMEFLGGRSTAFTCGAICGTKVAPVYRVDSPQINSVFTVSVGKNGVVDSSKSFQTLFSDSEAFDVSGLVGSNVFVQWQGDLSSGRSCPSSGVVVPIFYGGKFITVSQSYYSDYSANLGTLDSYVVAGNIFTKATTDAQMQNFVDANNRKADLVLGQVNIRSGQVIDGAKIVVPLTDVISFPTLTAYIKASWIGIVTPVGKPQITSVSAPCFESGSNGVVNLVVKNIGDQREQFSISGNCPSGFTVENSDIFLEGEASGTKSLKISGETATSKLVKSCTLTVRGLAFSDSESFDACVLPPKVCDANKLYCIGSDVMKCNSAGSDYLPQQSCSKGCLLDDSGVAYCKNDSGPRCIPLSTICDGNDVMKCNLLGTSYNLETTCAPPLRCAVDLNKNAYCSANLTCDARFLGLVKGQIGTKDECNFWCKLGLKSAEKVNVCVYDYVPLGLIGGFLLILTAILVFGLAGKGGKKSSTSKSSNKFSKIFKSKNFWKWMIGLGAFILLVLYFRIVVWIIVGVVVIFILDAIFLHRIIWKIVKKIFKR